MCVLLVELSFLETLEGKSNLHRTMDEKDMTKLLEKAHNAIVLSLGDKVLRQVSKEKTTTRLWMKLEKFYMTKPLVKLNFLS